MARELLRLLGLPRTGSRPAAPIPEGLGNQCARGVRPTPSTPSTRRPAGFGGHGLGVPYKDWLKLFGSPDIDALHDSLNILYSVCGPVNGKVSTDLTGGGVGVLHVHKSYKDALRFDATFQDIKEKVKADGILKEPSRFVRCPRPTPSSRRRVDGVEAARSPGTPSTWRARTGIRRGHEHLRRLHPQGLRGRHDQGLIAPSDQY